MHFVYFPARLSSLQANLMKKGDKVFELVKSMSMAEKRYFKIFANRHTIGTQNNYIKLFDLIEEMDTADSVLLADNLEAHGISAKHLSSDKNYLYKLILRGLSSFYAGKTISLKIKEQLHQVEILYERSLYDHSLTILRKAKKQAQKYDLYSLLIEISNWEQKSLNQLGKTEKAVEALAGKMEYMANMDNMNAFLGLFYQMLLLEKKIPWARNSDEFAELDRFMSHPFLQDESIPRSFQAKLYYWWIYAKYYFCINDKKQELVANEHVLSLMDIQDSFIEEFPDDYLEVYARILTLKSDLPDKVFDHALNHFNTFPERIKKSRKSLENRVFVLTAKIKLHRLVIQRRFQEAVELLAEIKTIVKKYDDRILTGEKLHFRYLFAYTLMAVGDYKTALSEVNKVLNNFSIEDNPNYYICTELLNLAIHYQLENYSVLKYRSDALKRLLSKEKLLHELENELLKLFKKLAKGEVKGRDYTKNILEDFLQLWSERSSDSRAEISFCLDPGLWIESNLKEVPMGLVNTNE